MSINMINIKGNRIKMYYNKFQFIDVYWVNPIARNFFEFALLATVFARKEKSKQKTKRSGESNGDCGKKTKIEKPFKS